MQFRNYRVTASAPRGSGEVVQALSDVILYLLIQTADSETAHENSPAVWQVPTRASGWVGKGLRDLGPS
jgi:hypothetical protein